LWSGRRGQGPVPGGSIDVRGHCPYKAQDGRSGNIIVRYCPATGTAVMCGFSPKSAVRIRSLLMILRAGFLSCHVTVLIRLGGIALFPARKTLPLKTSTIWTLVTGADIARSMRCVRRPECQMDPVASGFGLGRGGILPKCRPWAVFRPPTSGRRGWESGHPRKQPVRHYKPFLRTEGFDHVAKAVSVCPGKAGAVADFLRAPL